jgi:hypothetical protein
MFAKKTFYIDGIAAQGGIPNRNRRLYPPEVLGREIDRYLEEKIKTGSAFGELSHPDTPSIHLDRVSHIFREVRREGNNWHGKAALCDTPCGAIARGLMESGGRLGFSTRGLGSLKEDPQNKWNVVQDDYKLAVLADLVADPSAPSAFVKGVLEGIEFHQTTDGEWVAEAVEEIKKELKTKTVEQIKTDPAPFFKFFDRLKAIHESQFHAHHRRILEAAKK